MNFSSSVLTLEISGHVATLWLDRPEKRNAMSQEVVADLPRAMAAIAENDAIRAVVIAGRGKSFCVGIDLASLGAGGAQREDGEKVSGATANVRQIKITRAFQASISSVAELAAAITRRPVGLSVKQQRPMARPVCKLLSHRPMGSSWPKSISICAERERSWGNVRRVRTI